MAGLAAVDGVKDQGAVRFLAHGGAGVGAGGQAGGDDAVFRQAVQGTGGVFNVVPAVVCGDGQSEFRAGLHPPQGGGIVAVRLGVGGENDLVGLQGGDSGFLHPLHPGGDGGADG